MMICQFARKIPAWQRCGSFKSNLVRKTEQQYGGGNTRSTVDGRNPAPVEVCSLSHYLQGSIHPRWLARFLPSTVVHRGTI